MSFRVPECHRLRFHPVYGYMDSSLGNNGVFRIPSPVDGRRTLNVVASDGGGWEHVSVSVNGKPQITPSYREMCEIKAMFWEAEDTVVQYHPAESDYVNFHAGCLHLWRPERGEGLPKPPSSYVGPKGEAA